MGHWPEDVDNHENLELGADAVVLPLDKTTEKKLYHTTKDCEMVEDM